MSKESKITLKDGTIIKVTGGGDKPNASVSIYSGDYRDPDNHTATHININTTTGTGSIVEHGINHSDKQKTDIQCYLTTACMQHYAEEFDDNCYELTTLRWFRDKFVSKDDIAYYYEIAPAIVESINKIPGCEEIYNYIYKNVIDICVKAIEQGDYEFAYNRYKNSILAFEEEYVAPLLEKGKSKMLTKLFFA